MHGLIEAFPQTEKNRSLAAFCTFQVGGPADFFLVVKNKEDLKNAYLIAKKSQINTFILGGGSNLLFSDKGFRGLVIKNEAQNLEVRGDQIYAESGVLWSKLIQTAIENNLQGVERLIGLPGTLGAAVRGNAGCNGVETKDILIEASILNEETGNEEAVKAEYFRFDYRESYLKKNPQLVLSLLLQLNKHSGTPDDLRQTMKDVLLDRRSKQPTGKNAGSFFKNPPNNSAGRLIDECGLKGETEGGAQVSEQHGNFFMNKGQATQKDVVTLGARVAKIVYDKTKIMLEQEVYIIDELGSPIVI